MTYAFLNGKQLCKLLSDFIELKKSLSSETMIVLATYQVMLQLCGKLSTDKLALVNRDYFSYIL